MHNWVIIMTNGKKITVLPNEKEREMIECCADDEKRSLSNMLLWAFKRYVKDVKNNGGE